MPTAGDYNLVVDGGAVAPCAFADLKSVLRTFAPAPSTMWLDSSAYR